MITKATAEKVRGAILNHAGMLSEDLTEWCDGVATGITPGDVLEYLDGAIEWFGEQESRWREEQAQEFDAVFDALNIKASGSTLQLKPDGYVSANDVAGLYRLKGKVVHVKLYDPERPLPLDYDSPEAEPEPEGMEPLIDGDGNPIGADELTGEPDEGDEAQE